MSDGTPKRYEIGDRIPDLSLPAVGAEGERPLRGRARESVAIVFPHAPDCAECRAYVDGLTESGESFRRWDARLVVMLPAARPGGGDPPEARGEVFMLHDANDDLWPHIGRGCAAVVVADQWGAIYEVVHDCDGHRLPTSNEVVEWLRYIALQCPECGVPDTPGLGAWR